ncbi:MAG: hypothetical protein ACM3ZT_02440 [Bacillota bacterium]
MKAYVFLLCLLAPLPAFAASANFQYDYLDIGHLRLQPEGGSTGSGGFADLSYSVIDGVQFRADYASLSYPLAVSYKDYSVGFTGEEPLNSQTDIFTDVLYVNDRYNHLGNYISDDGYRLAIGFRHHPWAWDRLEVDGYLAHNFVGASYGAGAGSPSAFLPQSSNEVGLGLMFNATSWLALGAVVARDSTHTETTTLRLRLYF